MGGVKSPERSAAEKKYYTTGISANEIKNFTDAANILKKQFPMYVEINIPASKSGEIGKLLYEQDLFDVFLQNIMAAQWTRSMETTTGEIKNVDIGNQYGPSILQNSCLIRQDSFFKRFLDKGSGTDDIVSAKAYTTFGAPIIKTWLNSILDLDNAPSPIAVDGPQINAPPDFWMQGVPNQYWDWISHKYAPAYLKQIQRLRAQEGIDTHGSWASSIFDLDNIMVGKPVVFGKKTRNAQNFQMALTWAATKMSINKFINERVRTVHDVYAGKEAYSEVLFYEVVKFKSSTQSDDFDIASAADIVTAPAAPTPANQSFIQNIFIPNIPGMNTLNYIDTQVKFDKGYYYQIYAHTFVIGTHYELIKGVRTVKHKDSPDESEQWGLEYKYKPSVYLFRIPYHNTLVTANGAASKTGVAWTDDGKGLTLGQTAYDSTKLETTYMWDKPPVFPDAHFVPLYGEKDKILLNANFNIGEYDLEPVSIGAEDIATINKARINQHKLEGPISFKGDDFCGQIEILRIDQKPTSYDSFSPISNSLVTTVGMGVSNLGYVDNTILPNKNYYYVLREKDSHGNYSNPSPVYLVRIVARAGEAPYTIFKMFFMDELQEEKPLTHKNLIKYIKIKPSEKHSTLNEDLIGESTVSAITGDTKIIPGFVGEKDPAPSQPIWGQKFKFRFSSKKTGRKFDLNLTVKDIAQIPKENDSSLGVPDKYGSGKC